MTIEPAQQILFLVSWIITIKFLQLSVSSGLRPHYSKYNPAIAYPLSLLLFTICTLYAVSLSLPYWTALIPFIIIIGYQVKTHSIRLPDVTEGFVYDGIFGLFFIFALEFRFFNPIISHFSEQFMDHAFIASIMRMPILPPLDPWFSGGDLSMYYYGGHWAFAMISLIAHVPSVVSFNFIIPTVFGLSAVSLLMIGRMILNRFTWLPLISLVFIPPAILWYLISGAGIWTALNSTRWIITGCITEYPLFSLLLGDAHTHVMGLFNQFFLLSLILYLIIYWKKSDVAKKITGAVITAVSLGYMITSNSWDFMAYAPLVAAIGILFAWQTRGEPLWSRLFFLIATPALAFIIWSPLIMSMKTGSFTGIRWVTMNINPSQIMLYAGIFIGFIILLYREEIRKAPYLLIIPILLIASGYQTTAIVSMPLLCLIYHLVFSEKNEKMIFPIFLGVFGLSLICFFSLFQISLDSDATPMNTIFKLGYAAWILLSVSFSLFIGHYLIRLNVPVYPVIKKGLVVFCIICLLSAPWLARVDLARDLVGLSYSGGYQTFDGSAYLQHDFEDDYQGYQYAQTLPPGSVLLEGTGGDYSYSTPLSTFSGVPTVLGKFSHEFQWRGSRYGWMPERSDDIKLMYEEPEKSVSLLKKYQVTHIYVGKTEESLYNISLPLEDIKQVWSGKKASLYQVMTADNNESGIWQ